MGLKTFFFRKSSTSSKQLSGYSYDAAITSAPPIKGSYPIAGNGPSLDLIQRERERERARRLSTITPSPNLVRRREERREERPRTAPYYGNTGSGNAKIEDPNNAGRTFSGFSMKLPPNYFGSPMRSVKSKRESLFLPRTENFPPLPPSTKLGEPAEVPTRNETNPLVRNIVSPPPVQPLTSPPAFRNHVRTDSQASHRTHVDLVEAYSAIHYSREASQQRAKATGLRNYGEDVADRNIKDFGDRQLGFSSSEFIGLKSISTPSGKSREPYTRVDFTLDHVLESDDDTHKPQGLDQTFSKTSLRGARPFYPPRTDSVSPFNHKQLATTSIDEDPCFRYHRHNFDNSVRSSVSPERGRPRTKAKLNQSPVLFTSHKLSQLRQLSSFKLQHVHRTMSTSSAASQDTSIPSHRHASTKHSSISHPADASNGPSDYCSSDHDHPTASLQNTSAKRRGNMIVVGATKAPSLDGVVDLNDSVTTDVTTRKMPGTSPRSRPRDSIISHISQKSNSKATLILSPLHFATPHNTPEPPPFPPNWPLSHSPSRSSFHSARAVKQKQ